MPSEKPREVFLTTHWTQVLAAGKGDTSAGAALAELCRTYWYPLYAFVRRKGYSAEDAQDLTQEFFARLLARNSLGVVEREGGKFRSFLLRALERFLVDEWRKAKALKRGAGEIVSLDAQEAETRFRREPSHDASPEKLFEQSCAIALLERVYARLQEEYADRGELFAQLKPCLLGDRTALPYTRLAASLGQSEGAVKTHVHRLRQRFRNLLRETVAASVSSPADVEDELRSLLRALSGG